jgi:hypothetical protein
MADEAQAVPAVEAAVEAQDAQPTGADPGTKTEAAKTFTQTELDAIVTERLQRAQRKAEEQTAKARTEAERKAQEEQGEYKKLADSLKAELEQERTRAKALELAGLRRDVAARRNLPAGLVDRLRGETEQEIDADAEALLAALPKPQAPNINAGDASSKTPSLPGGFSEASLKEQAVRLGVRFEDFKAALVNGK